MAQIDINLKSSADVSGFAKTEQAIGSLSNRMTSLAQAMKTGFGIDVARRGLDLLGATARASIGDAFKMADTIKDGAANLSLSTTTFQVMGNALKDAGGDADQLAKAVTKLNLALVESRNDGSAAAGAFRQLGLSGAVFEGLTWEKRFESLGRAVANSKDQTAAFSSASILLGSKGLPAMLAALKDVSADGFDALAASMTAAGRVMESDTIARLDAAGKSLEKFKQSVTIFSGETIGGAMLAFDALKVGFASDKAGLFRAAGEDALKNFLAPWRILQGNGAGAIGDFLAKNVAAAPTIATRAPDADGTAAKLTSLTQARTAAENELAAAELARKTIEANPNYTEYQKRAHILELMQEEIKLRNILNAATEAVPISEGETEDAKQAKIDKLEAALDILRNRRSFLENQSDRKDNADADAEKYQRFQDDGGPGGAELGASADRGAKNYVSNLGSQAQQVAGAIESTIGNVVQGISDGIMGWIDGTKSFAQSLASIGQSVLKTMLSTIIQMGAQWLVNSVLIKAGMIGIEATGDVLRTGRVVKENAAEAATLPAKTAGAAASGISSFGVALAFGLIAVALIAGLAGGFADGGFTSPGGKHDVRGVVHAGEWVAPQWMVKDKGFGGIIAGLEGARTGSQGFELGGFTSPGRQLTRPAYTRSTERPAINILMDPAEFARLQQEHSGEWFESMTAQHMRKNS